MIDTTHYVACECGWDDQGELIQEHTPVGILYYGDEGHQRIECARCGEYLQPSTTIDTAPPTTVQVPR